MRRSWKGTHIRRLCHSDNCQNAKHFVGFESGNIEYFEWIFAKWRIISAKLKSDSNSWTPEPSFKSMVLFINKKYQAYMTQICGLLLWLIFLTTSLNSHFHFYNHFNACFFAQKAMILVELSIDQKSINDIKCRNWLNCLLVSGNEFHKWLYF